MTLRGKNPTEIKKRLKLLLYGSAGVGKTFTAIQFPAPYLIDTEKGAEHSQYLEQLRKQKGAIFQTCDFDELMIEVRALFVEKHHYKTLIIDPLTIIYNNEIDKAERKVGTEFGRHYGEANKKMKRLLNMLIRIDMNVIITSHAKNEYGKKMEIVGSVFDCFKKLDYLFDLVLELKKENKKRIAVIKKSRIKTFEESSSFDFSYEKIAELYGKDNIENEIKSEKLATKEQITELNKLIELLKVSDDVQQKWLSKASSATFEEMSYDNISKCLIYLNEKLKVCN